MGEYLRSIFSFSISASGTEMVNGERFAEDATGWGRVLKGIEAMVETGLKTKLRSVIWVRSRPLSPISPKTWMMLEGSILEGSILEGSIPDDSIPEGSMD